MPKVKRLAINWNCVWNVSRIELIYDFMIWLWDFPAVWNWTQLSHKYFVVILCITLPRSNRNSYPHPLSPSHCATCMHSSIATTLDQCTADVLLSIHVVGFVVFHCKRLYYFCHTQSISHVTSESNKIHWNFFECVFHLCATTQPYVCHPSGINIRIIVIVLFVVSRADVMGEQQTRHLQNSNAFTAKTNALRCCRRSILFTVHSAICMHWISVEWIFLFGCRFSSALLIFHLFHWKHEI